jgi:putative Holliday junction resolvase
MHAPPRRCTFAPTHHAPTHLRTFAPTPPRTFAPTNYNRPVRVLGIDYGARRIGLALSDATATLASPWRTIHRPPSEAETLRLMIAEIAALQQDADGLEAVVVGWPRRLDGSPGDQTPIVEAFAQSLKAHIDVPVILQDERLSSTEAEARLARRERDWRKRKRQLDAAAAAVILQDYLDSRPRTRPAMSENDLP